MQADVSRLRRALGPGIRRNLVFRTSALIRAMLWITDRFATGVELRDYPALVGGSRDVDGGMTSPFGVLPDGR